MLELFINYIYHYNKINIFIPSHSFIDTTDFCSAALVGSHLQLLLQNGIFYLEYFELPTKFQCVNLYNDDISEWPCRVCDYISILHINHAVKVSPKRNVFKDLKYDFSLRNITDKPSLKILL